MRKELLSCIKSLSDKEYRKLARVNDKRPQGGHDKFDYAIHFLFDDTDLGLDPDSWIDIILKITRRQLLLLK